MELDITGKQNKHGVWKTSSSNLETSIKDSYLKAKVDCEAKCETKFHFWYFLLQRDMTVNENKESARTGNFCLEYTDSSTNLKNQVFNDSLHGKYLGPNFSSVKNMPSTYQENSSGA